MKYTKINSDLYNIWSDLQDMIESSDVIKKLTADEFSELSAITTLISIFQDRIEERYTVLGYDGYKDKGEQ